MPLLPEDRLRHIAQERVTAHMSSLVKAELQIVPGKAERQWDPTLRRHIFSQQFTVRRDFDEIEVTVGPEGNILAFRDNNRFTGLERAEFQLLSNEEALNIARITGMVSERARVEHSERSDNQILLLRIVQDDLDYPNRVLFSINPNTRQVAAFNVLEDEP